MSDIRSKYEKAIKSMESDPIDFTITSPLPPELVGKTATIDATFSREQMVEMAKQDISWRYAASSNDEYFELAA